MSAGSWWSGGTLPVPGEAQPPRPTTYPDCLEIASRDAQVRCQRINLRLVTIGLHGDARELNVGRAKPQVQRARMIDRHRGIDRHIAKGPHTIPVRFGGQRKKVEFTAGGAANIPARSKRRCHLRVRLGPSPERRQHQQQ